MELQIKTTDIVELKNITQTVSNYLKQNHDISKHKDTLTLFVPHTTTAITINEAADPDVARDLETAFEKLVPQVPFKHAEGNSPAHFLSSIIGPSLTIPITNGDLDLGTWQGIFFCEFSGPRPRKLKLILH